MSGQQQSFRIDGQVKTFKAREGLTLLELLNHELRLTGTRFGCGQEQCGACMVLVDGAPVFSCTTLAETAADCTIETAGGLGPDDPLMAALLRHQAAQCAYCLPGIAMSARALLAKNPRPDAAAVRAALQPHLCRCGAHQRIVEAILSVGAE